MMPEKQQILILNGSIRKNKTTYSFANSFKQMAEQSGHQAEILHVIDYFEHRTGIQELVDKLQDTELLILVAPLYVDTLPYMDIWLLEELARLGVSEMKGKKMMALGQCGFPDESLNEHLLSVCELFAMHMGMKWMGGLSYGGGAILDGKPLGTLGRKGRKILVAMNLALSAVLGGESVPNEAQKLLVTKIPRVLLKPLAAILNYRSRKEGRKFGNHSLEATPYRLK